MEAQNSRGSGKVVYDAVFSCSGAADVGLVADRAARKISGEGAAKMLCITAIGSGYEELYGMARGARHILAINGCPNECARKVLEKAGFGGMQSLNLESLGFEKHKSPVDEAVVGRVAARAVELLRSAADAA